ncbi:hypothetical protein F511_36865 [Dorcoceras hygrometricum]|uniref:Uncharacterized protein n=1 Tax=Dorcoceras hygrometricum TaxID=472368 RepID=A0A2Z7BLL6_9LAMI|nr:hypothetical protein F511_36865 [Dorcoceras hygrometricum]
MVKHLSTSPHDPLVITDSAYKNHSVMFSIQYDPFNSNLSIRSTTIGNQRSLEIQQPCIHLGDQIVTPHVLLDVAISARMNEEVTRVSQHFGVLTIGFSSCDSGRRSANVDCVVMVAADHQARKYYNVEKRRRLNYLKRRVLSFSFERSAVGSNVYVSKVTLFGLVDASTF